MEKLKVSIVESIEQFHQVRFDNILEVLIELSREII
jgi:hypothetical protein